jgi:hypothetical protein
MMDRCVGCHATEKDRPCLARETSASRVCELVAAGNERYKALVLKHDAGGRVVDAVPKNAPPASDVREHMRIIRVARACRATKPVAQCGCNELRRCDAYPGAPGKTPTGFDGPNVSISDCAACQRLRAQPATPAPVPIAIEQPRSTPGDIPMTDALIAFLATMQASLGTLIAALSPGAGGAPDPTSDVAPTTDPIPADEPAASDSSDLSPLEDLETLPDSAPADAIPEPATTGPAPVDPPAEATPAIVVEPVVQADIPPATVAP